MKAALCFDGVDDDALVQAARPFLRHFDTIESWCAHGAEAEHLLLDVARRHHAPPHHPAIDAEQAEAIARRGVERLQRCGLHAVARTLGGRDAGHALAAASAADVTLVLSAGHRAGTGPKSVGHVARFVIDHARGPVLLLRLPIEDLRDANDALTR
jgi:nucleotide-binding universal stress UspA family protein